MRRDSKVRLVDIDVLVALRPEVRLHTKAVIQLILGVGIEVIGGRGRDAIVAHREGRISPAARTHLEQRRPIGRKSIRIPNGRRRVVGVVVGLNVGIIRPEEEMLVRLVIHSEIDTVDVFLGRQDTERRVGCKRASLVIGRRRTVKLVRDKRKLRTCLVDIAVAMKLAGRKLIAVGRSELAGCSGVHRLLIFIAEIKRRPIDRLVGQTRTDTRNYLIRIVAAGITVAARPDIVGRRIRQRIVIAGADQRHAAAQVEAPLVVKLQIVLRVEANLRVIVVDRSRAGTGYCSTWGRVDISAAARHRDRRRNFHVVSSTVNRDLRDAVRRRDHRAAVKRAQQIGVGRLRQVKGRAVDFGNVVGLESLEAQIESRVGLVLDIDAKNIDVLLGDELGPILEIIGVVVIVVRSSTRDLVPLVSK